MKNTESTSTTTPAGEGLGTEGTQTSRFCSWAEAYSLNLKRLLARSRASKLSVTHGCYGVVITSTSRGQPTKPSKSPGNGERELLAEQRSWVTPWREKKWKARHKHG